MALPPGHKKNFETLQRASDDRSLALMECLDRQTGKQAAVLCAVNVDGGTYEMVPVAMLLEENPYERFVPAGELPAETPEQRRLWNGAEVR